MYFQLKFKKAVYKPARFLLPFDLVRFQVGDNTFVKETVQVVEPSINPYTKGIDSFMHPMECFLRRVAAGPVVELYSFDGVKQRFFFRVKKRMDSVIEHPQLQQLLYWDPADYSANNPLKSIDFTGFKQYDSQMVKRKGHSLWYYGYRRQLNDLLKPADKKRFEELPYSENDLISAIQYLNYGTIWQPPAEIKEVCAKVFVTAGMAAAQASVIQTFDEKTNASFPWKIFPMFGAGLEIQTPKEYPSFCARVQLTWSLYKTGGGTMGIMNDPDHYRFAFDVKSLGLTIAPTWKIDDEWGPFSFYMGPAMEVEQLRVKPTQFGNNNMNQQAQDPLNYRFNKMIVSLGLYMLLRADKYAVTIQVPLASTKVNLDDSNFKLGKRQWGICFSYNLFGPKNIK
jgi:hypothetical protein